MRSFASLRMTFEELPAITNLAQATGGGEITRMRVPEHTNIQFFSFHTVFVARTCLSAGMTAMTGPAAVNERVIHWLNNLHAAKSSLERRRNVFLNMTYR